MFLTGDTIIIIYGNKKPKYGFYVSHKINREDLFAIGSEHARVLGYSEVIRINKSGKKILITYGDYPENTNGFLRAFSTRMVLIEKTFRLKQEEFHTWESLF